MSTFMHDVLQPGNPDDLFQCVVKRDRTKSTYTLSLGFGSPPVTEGKFLLVARKVRRATSIEYVISSDDAFNAVMSKESGANVVGKLRSNILSTNFTIYESQLLRHNGEVSSNGGRSMRSTEVVPGVLQARNFKVGQVYCDLERDYDPVIWKGRRPRSFPRRTRCTLYTIPASTIDDKGFARSAPTEFPAPRVNSNGSFRSLGLLRCLQSKSAVSDSRVADFQSIRSELLSKDKPLVLKSRAPRWNDQLRSWRLNFRGRVTVRSVKNFQLVAATQPNQTRSETSDHGKVLLQFGKIGKDVFTMDYRYPFSALQAFAICLTNFEKKCYI